MNGGPASSSRKRAPGVTRLTIPTPRRASWSSSAFPLRSSRGLSRAGRRRGCRQGPSMVERWGRDAVAFDDPEEGVDDFGIEVASSLVEDLVDGLVEGPRRFVWAVVD